MLSAISVVLPPVKGKASYAGGGKNPRTLKQNMKKLVTANTSHLLTGLLALVTM